VGGVATGLLRRLFRIKRLWIVLGSFLAVYILASSCATYVPPNMIGIRQVYFGSRAGIKPESYYPGLHFIVAGRRAAAPVPARPAGHQLQRLVERGVGGRACGGLDQDPDERRLQRPARRQHHLPHKDPYHRLHRGPGPAARSRTGSSSRARIAIPAQDAGRAQQRGVLSGPEAHREVQGGARSARRRGRAVRHRDRGRARARLQHLRPEVPGD